MLQKAHYIQRENQEEKWERRLLISSTLKNKLFPRYVIWCSADIDYILVLDPWGFSLPHEVQKHSEDQMSSKCLNSNWGCLTLSSTLDQFVLRCGLLLPLFYHVLWKSAKSDRRCCAWMHELGYPEMSGVSHAPVLVICWWLLHLVCKAVYETLASLCFYLSCASHRTKHVSVPAQSALWQHWTGKMDSQSWEKNDLLGLPGWGKWAASWNVPFIKYQTFIKENRLAVLIEVSVQY